MDKRLFRDVRDLSFENLQKCLESISEPKYRAQQIFVWLYQKRVDSFREMKNLPGELIKKLENDFFIFQPEVVKKQISKIDGTVKYLLKLADGELIETVIIPAPLETKSLTGQAGKRITICLSTQVGCRFRCKFCASGLYGFRRNLSQAEILSQLILAQNDGYKVTNIVFMGIGEPLDNFNNVIGAIKIINDKDGFNIGARKITISTAGIPEKIKELANLGLQIELSISLHAGDNKKRDMLMPINKVYPLEILLKTLKEYYLKTKRLITFEYIIIKDINDSPDDANKLTSLLKGLKCKVNLIPFSPIGEIPYQSPDREKVLRFEEILRKVGISATIRMSKGIDISAACGQLRIRNFGDSHQN